MLRLQLLGGFKAWVDDRPIEGFVSSKAPALLCFLAVSKRAVSRDELAGLLWSDQPEDVAKTSLRQVLSNLNKLLGEHLRIERNCVELDFTHPVQIDAQTLEDFASQLEPDLQQLAHAVQEYRGDFLQSFHVKEAPEFEEWVITQREHYRLLVLRLLDQLTHDQAAQGQYSQAISYARRILELEPWREETHRSLMLWLARSGQRSAALKQYQDCQAILSRELGVAPSAQTTALYQRLQAAITSSRSHLPTLTTPLIGREEELNTVLARLHNPTCHLLTLSGPGGIGKTRLALEVAVKLEESLINGACFVPLVGVESPDLLVPTIASAAGLTLSPNGSLEDQLIAFLGAREMLLVLDNLEQLLIAPALRSQTQRLMNRILSEAPDTKLLLTSRVRLNLKSETVLDVDGVTQDDALQLFVESARRVESHFKLEAGSAVHAQRICALVQGNPLGIELASAQVRGLSPQDIANAIQHSSDFLTSDMADAPQRQQSMRAVFEHSWRLLFEPERELFQKLSVFRGGFTLEAAQQVAGTTPQTLMALVDKSLLKRTWSGRYELHELMRQFGEEKLDADCAQAPQVRDFHRDYFATWMDTQEQRSRTSGMREALEQIASDYPNLRSAWQRALDQLHVETLFGMVMGFQFFFLRSGRVQEGYALLSQAVDHMRQRHQDSGNPQATELLARTLTQVASLQSAMGEFAEAREKALEAVGLYRALNIPRQLSRSLTYVGNTSYYLGDTEDAARAWAEALEISRQTGDETQMAVMLGNLGHISMIQQDFAGAESRFREALKIHRKSGETARIAIVLSSLGELATSQGKSEEALPVLLEALQINRANGDRPKTALVLTNLSVAFDRIGKPEEHQEAVNEALAIAREVGALDLLAATLSNKAHLCGILGQASQAYGFAREAVEVARQMNSTTMTTMVGVALCSTACALGLYFPATLLGAVLLRNPGRRSSDTVSAESSYQTALAHLSPEQVSQAEAEANQLELPTAIELVLDALKHFGSIP